MNDILNFAVNTLIAGALLVSSGLLIERWLVNNGFSRNNKTIYIIIFAVCSAFIRQIWFTTGSWWCLAPFAILAMILGVNRGDLWTTMSKGRWWWKPEKQQEGK